MCGGRQLTSFFEALLFNDAEVRWFDETTLGSHYIFPNLISSALLVYKYIPITPDEETWCSGTSSAKPSRSGSLLIATRPLTAPLDITYLPAC